jgi:hypothetical protein
MQIKTEHILLISAGAGLVSALLPSVPTIVRYWDDTTPVLGLVPYNRFLKGWLVASLCGLAILGAVAYKQAKGSVNVKQKAAKGS